MTDRDYKFAQELKEFIENVLKKPNELFEFQPNRDFGDVHILLLTNPQNPNDTPQFDIDIEVQDPFYSGRVIQVVMNAIKKAIKERTLDFPCYKYEIHVEDTPDEGEPTITKKQFELKLSIEESEIEYE